MSDWSQRKTFNNDGMDPDWRPTQQDDETVPSVVIDSLRAQLAAAQKEIDRNKADYTVSQSEMHRYRNKWLASEKENSALNARCERMREALKLIASSKSIATDGSESAEEFEELYDFWHLVAIDRHHIASEALRADEGGGG